MTRMTEKSEYNSSLIHLQESLREVMEGEFTPQEIHEVIIDNVKDNMRYYKACYNDSVRLLALLRGNTNSSIKVHDNFEEIAPGIKAEKVDGITSEWSDYWNGNLYGEDFNRALEKYGYEYTPPTPEEIKRFKLDSPCLHEGDD